jgi:hypothetical protein
MKSTESDALGRHIWLSHRSSLKSFAATDSDRTIPRLDSVYRKQNIKPGRGRWRVMAFVFIRALDVSHYRGAEVSLVDIQKLADSRPLKRRQRRQIIERYQVKQPS